VFGEIAYRLPVRAGADDQGVIVEPQEHIEIEACEAVKDSERDVVVERAQNAGGLSPSDDLGRFRRSERTAVDSLLRIVDQDDLMRRLDEALDAR
jgi:hypothetical protein